MKDEEKKEEPIDFAKYLVERHKKISVDVTDKDLKAIIDDSHIMYNLCFTKIGLHNGYYAIAHPQINKKRPLRFFVTKEKDLIINPKITRHTKTTVDSLEGCATFPDMAAALVQRYHKCEVEYQTLSPEGKLRDITKEGLSGLRARIFQHEIDHLDAIYIYKEKNKN